MSWLTLLYTLHHILPCHTYAIPIDDATLLGDVISVFGCHQEVFDGLASSKIDLYAILLTSVFETFTQAFAVRNSYIGSSDVRLGVVVFQPLAFVSGLCKNLGLLLNSFQGPSWVFA